MLQRQDLHSRVRQNKGLFGDSEAPIQRHQHRAKPGTSVEQDEIVRPIQAEDRNSIAFADAELALQSLRGLRDARGKGGVGQGGALKADRGLVGRKGSVTLD